MRNILICLIIAVFCLSPSPVSAQEDEAISTPILGSVPNFRDIAGISASNGGTGFANPTSNNGVMLTGVFYRTNVLTLAPQTIPTQVYLPILPADQNTVSGLNIGLYIDLRTPSDINSTVPNWLPTGATGINIDIYSTQTQPSQPPFNTATVSQMVSYMESLYTLFVTSPVERSQLGQVLLTLAHTSTSALYHCDAGKDRTGWTSALLESIAGVSSATIMTDYLATNKYTASLISTVGPQLKALYPGSDLNAINAVLGVSSDYLNTALDQVIASYGSMNAYLIQGLGLSLADIYVLRAKMVYYSTLPGQSGLDGNAAAGAGLLNALQSSPLSGNYTAFNYYLQSAIDAGTLGSLPDQVGGQIYADAASFALRLSQWIDEAVMSYTRGCNLGEGKTHTWAEGIGGIFSTGGSSSAASSREYNGGMLMGATHRFNDHVSADMGIGYDWGSVHSAGASATVNTLLTTVSGRYGLSSLETGPFVTARADAGYVDCGCTRPLDGGLDNAAGKTAGALYGGIAELGDIIRFAPFNFTLQTGARVIGVRLHSFDESGSELALGFDTISKTYSSLLVDLGISLDCRQLGTWAIAPTLALGYERAFANPSVQSTGTIYGYSVIQYSAFDSRDLTKAGLTVTAQHGAFMVTAEINGLMGGAADSLGLNGQVSVNYRF